MQPTTAEITASVQMARCGRQILGVQHAEVLRHFPVLAHGIGDARAGVHAGKRGADQRQENRERLAPA